MCAVSRQIRTRQRHEYGGAGLKDVAFFYWRTVALRDLPGEAVDMVEHECETVEGFISLLARN